eukprot:2130224-Amphidinium_carterae.1
MRAQLFLCFFRDLFCCLPRWCNNIVVHVDAWLVILVALSATRMSLCCGRADCAALTLFSTVASATLLLRLVHH